MTEIADYWCNFLTPDGIEQSPDEDPRREIYQAWKGFTVFGLAIEHEKPVQALKGGLKGGFKRGWGGL